MLAVATTNARAESFNDLFALALEHLPSSSALTEDEKSWVCTEEDALRPEKDLLGMCPGGKRHILADPPPPALIVCPTKNDPAVLVSSFAISCPCDYCRYIAKAATFDKRIRDLRKDLEKMREKLEGVVECRREAARLLRTVRVTPEREEEDHDWDPVFSSRDG